MILFKMFLIWNYFEIIFLLFLQFIFYISYQNDLKILKILNFYKNILPHQKWANVNDMVREEHLLVGLLKMKLISNFF